MIRYYWIVFQPKKLNEADETSVPLRVEVPLEDHTYVHEIFNFRTISLPDSIFQVHFYNIVKVFDFLKLPELAPCKTSHTPAIPSMSKSFHVKMEVNDRIGWENTGNPTSYSTSNPFESSWLRCLYPLPTWVACFNVQICHSRYDRLDKVVYQVKRFQ